MLEQMPFEIVQQIRQGKREIYLPGNVCRVVYGDKQPYERYPTPILKHAFEALAVKYDLLAMDQSTARSVRNRILQVTIGSDQLPVTDDTEIRKLAQLFNSPSRSLTLFWNHTLQIKWIEPSLDSLRDDKKYNVWNDEIRTAFGISRILTGTSETAGAIGNSIMNFKGVEEEVGEAQAAFIEWLMEEITLLRMALGVSHEVKIKFDSLNLKDEVKFTAVITQMVQNGLLDEETALETLKYHFPTIVARKKKMKKFHDQGLFLAKPSANNLGPGGDPKKGGGTPTGGKPANQPLADNNANKKGTSQPKKATAKIIPISAAQASVVVDMEQMSSDERQDIAQAFDVPKDWVLTVAEYTERFGEEPDMEAGWPDLSDGELVQVARQAVAVAQEIDTEADRILAESQKGKRMYVTAKRREAARAHASTAVLAKFKPESITDKTWSRRLEITRANLAVDDLPPEELDVLAVLSLARRYTKAAKK